MVVDDSKPNPSAVRSQLREWEDYNYAMRLQDEEFGHHYDQNRQERRTVGSDTRVSKVVQQQEDDVARAIRRQNFRQIEETDEQIAQRLAAEWKAEESRRAEEKLRQELVDEEIAKRLSEGSEYNPNMLSSSSELPSQPPPYDFAASQPRQEMLIDFADSNSNQTPSSSGYQNLTPTQLNTPTIRSGVPLPGLTPLATSSTRVLPPSQDSLDSPVNWPAPPASVLNSQLSSTNPFLPYLMSTNPQVLPPSIGFVQPAPSSSTNVTTHQPPINSESEFGLPPPSSLALGHTGIGSRPF